MSKLHLYKATTRWTGNNGKGTVNYTDYSRNHEISIPGKGDLACSSDPAFRGDGARHNPEDLLVSALSGCHMLWYLHLCAENGVVVTGYVDEAKGEMEFNRNGSGQFREVILNPKVTVLEASMIAKANELHHEANNMCFLARSMNFPVSHRPTAFVATISQ